MGVSRRLTSLASHLLAICWFWRRVWGVNKSWCWSSIESLLMSQSGNFNIANEDDVETTRYFFFLVTPTAFTVSCSLYFLYSFIEIVAGQCATPYSFFLPAVTKYSAATDGSALFKRA